MSNRDNYDENKRLGLKLQIKTISNIKNQILKN